MHGICLNLRRQITRPFSTNPSIYSIDNDATSFYHSPIFNHDTHSRQRCKKRQTKNTYIGGNGEETTLYTAIPTLPIATANNTYATNNASSPSTFRPLDFDGLPSSPILVPPPPPPPVSVLPPPGRIVMESAPVPNEAPTAIRDQNS